MPTLWSARPVRLAVRCRVIPKPHNQVRVMVFVPRGGDLWHGAGALAMSEPVWRLLLYPLLRAGAARVGVTLTLEG